MEREKPETYRLCVCVCAVSPPPPPPPWKQSGESSPCERTWEALVRLLTSHLRAAFSASSFVKDTFVSAYPRLLSLVEAMLDRVMRETEVKGVAPAIKAEERHQLTVALEPFQVRGGEGWRRCVCQRAVASW